VIFSCAASRQGQRSLSRARRTAHSAVAPCAAAGTDSSGAGTLGWAQHDFYLPGWSCWRVTPTQGYLLAVRRRLDRCIGPKQSCRPCCTHACTHRYFRGDPSNNLGDLVYRAVFCGSSVLRTPPKDALPHNRHALDSYCEGGLWKDTPERDAQVAWIFFRLAFWCCVAGMLHRRRWYWAL
jgi:hypothetical protein